jgi:hypothetical protein
MDTEANDLKVRENRLRRAAARQKLFLSRSRRRDPPALDYGRYALLRDGAAVHGVAQDGAYTLTLDEVETLLAAGAAPPPPPADPEPVATQPQPDSHPAPPLVPRRRGLGARTPRRGR